MKYKYLVIGALLLVLGLVLVACSPQPAPTTEATPCPAAPPCPDCPPPPELEPCPEPVVKDVPFQEMWVNSPHADAAAEAFIHWNEDDPAEVPADCARCHSTPGYQDYVGADGSAVGSVENNAPIGTVVECVACHNAGTANLTNVTFPSGAEISGLGAEARCMVCHQGRASKVQIDSALDELGITEDLDTPTAELGFINIHYFAAAATLYGTETQGGYQYAGKSYDAKNDHVAGYDTCIGCHNPHTLVPKLEECQACHLGVTEVEDLSNIRMAGSLVDYDGDSDVSEGIAAEIEGLEAMLLQAIHAYGSEVAGSPITYDQATYPYFFIDTNEDGQTTEDEAQFGNAYASWTGRLLKAAYNYQTAVKDPGAFAHGGKYIIQLLYDSIEDLNTAISTPVDLSQAHRIDAGHFAGSEEAFRHWDVDGEVAATCVKCHTGTGLPFFLEHSVTIAMDPSNGLNCATCHNDLTTFTRFETVEVTFPSGAVLDTGSLDSNLCINCHQGRESTVSVNAAINRAGVGDDEISEVLSFRNVHYFAAGATLFGSEAMGAYEFANELYNGRFMHVAAFDTCIECHNAHALTVNVESCSACHANVQSEADLLSIRLAPGDAIDYDGDGDTAEGIALEIEGVQEALYAAIQAYATNTAGSSIVYNPSSHPYFFVDANGNGETDPDETDRYVTWTPNLLRAAYNYQYAAKDPGAFAHNADYILQVMFDSIGAVGGSTSGLTRPALPDSQ
jgi:hypothetical protein